MLRSSCAIIFFVRFAQELRVTLARGMSSFMCPAFSGEKHPVVSLQDHHYTALVLAKHFAPLSIFLVLHNSQVCLQAFVSSSSYDRMIAKNVPIMIFHENAFPWLYRPKR